MRSHSMIAAAGMVSCLVTLPAGAESDTATGEEYVPDLEMEALHRAPIPGMEGKEMIVVRITAPPGYVGEAHTHPGPVYMYVIDGEVVLEVEGEAQRAKAGELLPEPVDTTMVPRNASETEPAHMLVFQIGTTGEPMMIKAE